MQKHIFLFSYWDSKFKNKVSNIVKEKVLKINFIWMILWQHEYKWVLLTFIKFLVPNKLFFYLKCRLNSGILIQNLFWNCIWLQNKSCSFWMLWNPTDFHNLSSYVTHVLEFCLKHLFWEFIRSLATLGHWQAGPITVATKKFGGKFCSLAAWAPNCSFIWEPQQQRARLTSPGPWQLWSVYIYRHSKVIHTNNYLICNKLFFMCNILWISCIVEVWNFLKLIYYFLYVKWISMLLSKLIPNWIACVSNKIPKITEKLQLSSYVPFYSIS
jgi:hypothetical protein